MAVFEVLKTEFQNFIQENLYADLTKLILKGSPFKGVSIQKIAIQIEAKKKAKKKLPSWFSAQNIVYPPVLNIEQTSSEITANYKASILQGKNIVDLTGGFGVDSFFFSKTSLAVTHCEIDPTLSAIAKHNFKILSSEDNCTFFSGSGIDFLQKRNQNVDGIYIDPSRRNLTKSRVFQLEDCEPNILNYLDLFFSKSPIVLVKTSPLLDINLGVQQLPQTKEVHIVAVNNEVKELLWVLTEETKSTKNVLIKTLNFIKNTVEVFEGFPTKEHQLKITYTPPLGYLYEPNAAIMKSNLFVLLAEKFQLSKIAKHSHLYTSTEQIAFPGRSFLIEKTILFNKKNVKKLGIKKANISTRNFPLSVEKIRKKFDIKDGGAHYLFFTTESSGKKIIIHCRKV